MRTEIVFRKKDWLTLTNYLSLDKINESGAIAFCKISTAKNFKRFLVNRIVLPEKKHYKKRSAGFIGFDPEFMEQCFKNCENSSFHLIDIHTHPFSNNVHFSSIDDREDGKIKGPYMDKYVPSVELLFMVHGSDLEDIDARIWDKNTHSLRSINLIKIW